MVRDRAISNEFLTHRVVQQYSVPTGKMSVFATFGSHLGKGISSPVMLGGRYIPRQWSCSIKIWKSLDFGIDWLRNGRVIND